MDFLFDTSQPWEHFGVIHFTCIAVFLVFTFLIIGIAKNLLDRRKQRILGLLVALIPTVAVIVRMASFWSTDVFFEKELPIYICRILALALPFSLWYRHRASFGIMYFWVLAGTLNAIITPDADFGFPHYLAWQYWFLHAGLITAVLYGVFVLRLRPVLRDIWRAFLAANVYFLVIHGINVLMDTNYSYTMKKPPGGSLLDFMGPWPYYILSVELLAVVLFFIVYIPFAFAKKKRR